MKPILDNILSRIGLNLTLDIYLNKNIKVNVKGLIRTIIFSAPQWLEKMMCSLKEE
jgi:hypothetical protein